jgi:predicted unusual protein kinase regulating ubiquinone biosynthesis (AarF/ABC1/UbiB family)
MNGFLHNDLHVKNLMWDGKQMYIIDFSTIRNINKNKEREDIFILIMCKDYRLFLKSIPTESYGYQNLNYGFQRLRLLIDFVDKYSCQNINYIDRLIDEYEILDKLDESQLEDKMERILYDY